MRLPHVPEGVPCKRRPEWMFPDDRKAEEVERAKRVCRSGVGGKPCPFLTECLAYSLRWNLDGVWAGTDADERKAMRKRHGIVAKSITPGRGVLGWGLEPHGTAAAYQRHRRRGENACRDCLDAHNRYKHPDNPSNWQAS